MRSATGDQAALAAATGAITGDTAAAIAASVRHLIDTGMFRQGDPLPASRALAWQLGVNRNTVISAYRQLAAANLTVGNRGGGTTIAETLALPEEGFLTEEGAGSDLRDVSSGNPSRTFLPDPSSVRLPAAEPVLYGESTLDPGLRSWAQGWFEADVRRSFELTVTGGSVEALEILLAQTLGRSDAVALEDPCFLSSIALARRAGYRTVPIPVDSEGMTASGLAAALGAGVRALVCTPRAHNPTGVSLSEARAEELREVLADYPHVLIIEDDHFSMLATTPLHSIIPEGHHRWALVRSFSKFLGPDLRMALVASDTTTAARLSQQISAGTRWVSHFLQRVVCAMATAKPIRARIDEASRYYRERNAAFISLLAASGLVAESQDGLNIWLHTPAATPSALVCRRLRERGWLARNGESFSLSGSATHRLRLTVHSLVDADAQRLAIDLIAATDSRG